MELLSPHGLKKEAVLAAFALCVPSYCCLVSISFELFHVFANFGELGWILRLCKRINLYNLLTKVSHSLLGELRKVCLEHWLWLKGLRAVKYCSTWNPRIRQTIAWFWFRAIITTLCKNLCQIWIWALSCRTKRYLSKYLSTWVLTGTWWFGIMADWSYLWFVRIE